MIGKSGYGQNSVGDPNARMLDVTFDDEIWLQGTATNNSVQCSGRTSDGLGGTGFTLVETGKNTGVFTGDFQVPNEYLSLIHI